MALKRIIVAHPGKQHSFQTASALKESGMLVKYITTVYDKKDSWLCKFKGLLKGKNMRKAGARKTETLYDDDVLLFNELGGLLMILLGKLHLNRIFSDWLNHIVHKSFARKVARYAIDNHVDAVIMYDSNVYHSFDMMKKHGIKCILDVTIASRSYMRKIYEKDMKEFHDMELKKEQSFLWNEKWLKGYDKEFVDADYCFVGSEFVKKSISEIVADKTKIYVIPYGVNFNMFHNFKRNYEVSPLRLLFVGGVSMRKGIHHLLKVVSTYSASDVTLTIAGAYNPNCKLYKKYALCKNINFVGFVTRDMIAALYESSHVFVLPSLAEGMAMVGLEALASGLPVVCSDNTGLTSVVKDGYNGYVIHASDEVALKSRIDWLLTNKEKIEEMSRNAATSVDGYSWDDYKHRLVDTLSKIF